MCTHIYIVDSQRSSRADLSPCMSKLVMFIFMCGFCHAYFNGQLSTLKFLYFWATI